MTTRSASIIAAVEATLTATRLDPLPAGAVYTNLLVPLERNALPALVVELGGEGEPGDAGRTIGYVDHQLEITTTVLIDSAAPYTAAEDAREATHARLVADRTLGGLALHLGEGPTSRQRHDSGIGIITTSWTVTYRTATDSLT